VATTLNYDYEVRSASEAFRDIKPIKIEGEMLDLAQHIIKTKKGTFKPEEFEDRYEAAVVELVKAKLEGRKIRPPKPQQPTKVVDLLEALRQSAGADDKKTKASASGKSAAKKTGTRKKTAAATPRQRKAS
jgi:DNA end-binding protein Ku